MSFSIPTPPRISLVDANGKITRPWFLWFESIFQRIGGSAAPSIPDLEAALAQLPDTSQSIEARIAIVEGYAMQLPVSTPDFRGEPQDGRLQALEAEVAALRVLFEGLAQGYQV